MASTSTETVVETGTPADDKLLAKYSKSSPTVTGSSSNTILERKKELLRQQHLRSEQDGADTAPTGRHTTKKSSDSRQALTDLGVASEFATVHRSGDNVSISLQRAGLSNGMQSHRGSGEIPLYESINRDGTMLPSIGNDGKIRTLGESYQAILPGDTHQQLRCGPVLTGTLEGSRVPFRVDEILIRPPLMPAVQPDSYQCLPSGKLSADGSTVATVVRGWNSSQYRVGINAPEASDVGISQTSDLSKVQFLGLPDQLKSGDSHLSLEVVAISNGNGGATRVLINEGIRTASGDIRFGARVMSTDGKSTELSRDVRDAEGKAVRLDDVYITSASPDLSVISGTSNRGTLVVYIADGDQYRGYELPNDIKRKTGDFVHFSDMTAGPIAGNFHPFSGGTVLVTGSGRVGDGGETTRSIAYEIERDGKIRSVTIPPVGQEAGRAGDSAVLVPASILAIDSTLTYVAGAGQPFDKDALVPIIESIDGLGGSGNSIGQVWNRRTGVSVSGDKILEAFNLVSESGGGTYAITGIDVKRHPEKNQLSVALTVAVVRSLEDMQNRPAHDRDGDVDLRQIYVDPEKFAALFQKK